MFQDSFAPSLNANASAGGGYSTVIVTPAPTTSSAQVALPAGGSVFELYNSSAITVYAEFGVGTATATVPTGTAGSYPIAGGQVKLVRRPFVGGIGCNVVATITASGTGALAISAGDGM